VNQSSIPGIDKKNVDLIRKGEIQIRNATEYSTGNYTCFAEARDTYGKVTSHDITNRYVSHAVEQSAKNSTKIWSVSFSLYQLSLLPFIVVFRTIY